MQLLADDAIAVSSLISHRYDLTQAQAAYDHLSQDKQTLGILLQYAQADDAVTLMRPTVALLLQQPKSEQVAVGFIGSGNYAGRVLMPAFKEAKAHFSMIACQNGISGVQLGKKWGCEQVTTAVNEIFNHEQVNTVVIATRHHTHAQFVMEAVNAGKHVFVEKPLCVTYEELNALKSHLIQARTLVMVGFNRRFAPHIKKMKSLLGSEAAPKSFIMTVNAGHIPLDHWTQDKKIGGGRIIGEACHFIDLLRYLANATIVDFKVSKQAEDQCSITLCFADHSFGTIHYFANGHSSFPKERLEVFVGGKVLQIDNFRRMSGWGWKAFSKMNLWRQDKGQKQAVQQFVNAINTGGPSPIPLAEILEVAEVTLQIANAL